MCLCFFAARVNVSPLAVNWDQVFWLCIALGCGTSPCLLGGFEPVQLWQTEWIRCMKESYVDSCRKRLTLCIVMSAVGEEEIMIMGYKVPISKRNGLLLDNKLFK